MLNLLSNFHLTHASKELTKISSSDKGRHSTEKIEAYGILYICIHFRMFLPCKQKTSPLSCEVSSKDRGAKPLPT